jgi:alkaline phosphatase
MKLTFRKLISAPVIKASLINYAHTDHTGVDTNVHAAGVIAKKFLGNTENTFICETISNFLGLNMTDTNIPGIRNEEQEEED